MNVHLRANVFNFFLQIITSLRVDKNGKMFYTRRIYTFYVIWLTQCFLHLKISSIWRIYTSMRVFFKICFCKLTIIVFLTLEYLNIFSTRRIYSSVQVDETYVFYLMNIHLCASWWKWSWIVPLTYTWALWVEWWGITKCPLFMAVQVHKNQADKLGNVYSKGERLLCRIWSSRERRKQTKEYSKLTNSRVPALDGLLHERKQFHRNIPT